MNKKRKELISYTLDFVSYLINQVEDIERVILFGSVARGDFDDESDIDLFIDTPKKAREKEIAKLVDTFHRTQKAKSWELKGITNPFSCVVGKLDGKEWQDLKRGMINNGIILYGKYKASGEKINHYTLFSFGRIKPESKRVSIHRKLFGFTAGKKKYRGLVDEYNLVKLGKGSLLVPVEHAAKIKQLFKEKKVAVKVYDVWSDYKVG